MEKAIDIRKVEISDVNTLAYIQTESWKSAFNTILSKEDLDKYTDINKAIELYRVRYREKGIFENRLYEGIKTLLEKLKEEGYILAVASSKPEVFVKKILTYFEIDKYFTAIAGASLDGKLSAKKDVILKALEQLNATDKKDQCIMIGDREHDVKGAISNSILCIGCLWGYGSENELKEAGCSILVNKAEMIPHFSM